MSVVLSDEQYGALYNAITEIARGRYTTPAGHAARISQRELIQIARRTCVAVGFEWNDEGETANE